ncbi:MAG: hypothetical protein ACFCUR_06175 [Rhodomicrobiaceae bacterium]
MRKHNSGSLRATQAEPVRANLRFDKIELRSKRKLTDRQQYLLQRTCDSADFEIRGAPTRGPASGMKEFVRIVSPNPQALEFLSSKSYVVPTSVEIALDIPTEDHQQAMEWVSFFDRHFAQRWHGSSRCLQIGYGTYTKRSGSARLFVWYGGKKPLKGTKTPGFHIECRLSGIAALRAIGIETSADLLNFDHRAFWDNHLTLYEVDQAKLGRLYSKLFPDDIPRPHARYDVEARLGSLAMHFNSYRSRDEDQYRVKGQPTEDQFEWREPKLMQHLVDRFRHGDYLQRLAIPILTGFR